MLYHYGPRTISVGSYKAMHYTKMICLCPHHVTISEEHVVIYIIHA